jgi:hypothetical protein
MAKILKQTMSEIDEKKHVIRFNSDDTEDKSLPFTSVYISREALKKAGVKGRIKSIDIQVTVHEGGK